jgi:hypothetical protein
MAAPCTASLKRSFPINSVVARLRAFVDFSPNEASLRFRDALLGAISLLLVVLGVILLPLATSLGGAESSVRRAFSILFFFFRLRSSVLCIPLFF